MASTAAPTVGESMVFSPTSDKNVVIPHHRHRHEVPPGSPRSYKTSFKHNIHRRQDQRPLSTYTSLGSPIHTTRTRSLSLGSNSSGSPTLFGSTTSMDSAVHRKRVMEDTSAAERSRVRALEEQEKHYNADELRAVLKKERLRAAKIHAELETLRSGTAQQTLQAEVLEEGRLNGLMRRLDILQEEKSRISVELEREEEMLNNTLQRKLNQIRHEKQRLQEEIELETNMNVVLKHRLAGMRSDQMPPPSESLEEQDEMEQDPED